MKRKREARSARRRRHALKRIQQFLRSQGVKLSLKEVRGLVDRLAPLVPRIVPQPRGKAEALHVVVERNGNLEAIATAAAPDFLVPKSGKKHKFKDIWRLRTKKGSFMLRADSRSIAICYSGWRAFDYWFLDEYAYIQLLNALIQHTPQNVAKLVVQPTTSNIYSRPGKLVVQPTTKYKRAGSKAAVRRRGKTLIENLKEILKEKREADEK